VRPPRPGLLVLYPCLLALWAAPVHAQELRSAASPDEVLEKAAAVPTEEPAPPSDHHVRLKLSLEGFSIGTTWGMPVGLPATRWMAELGAFALRSDTELLLKSRRVVPGRLLEAGFAFEYARWSEAAADLVRQVRDGRGRDPRAVSQLNRA